MTHQEEYREWHLITIRSADGAETSEWLFAAPEFAAMVATMDAGPAGKVLRCDVAEIPPHARRTGWTDADLPRSYQG